MFCKQSDCKNRGSNYCYSCKRNVEKDYYEPLTVKDGGCFCTCCKKIYTSDIFPNKDDPTKGICFNCF